LIHENIKQSNPKSSILLYLKIVALLKIHVSKCALQKKSTTLTPFIKSGIIPNDEREALIFPTAVTSPS